MAASQPLTIDVFARAYRVSSPEPVRVQVMKRGVVLCGLPVDFAETRDAGLMFKVSTSIGPMWVTQRNTRQCSGVDGHCMCAGEDLAARGDAERRASGETGRGGACCVPPLGNTGGTTVAGAPVGVVR